MGGIRSHIRNLETLAHLIRDEAGGALVALILVFVVDGRVMLGRVFAAFEH